MDKLLEVKSIGLDSEVVVEMPNGELKSTIKLQKGMHVYVKYNTILDCSEERSANATVTELMGDIFGTQLEAHLILSTGEEVKLILK